MKTTKWGGLLMCALQILPPGALAGSISGLVRGPFFMFPLAGINVSTYDVTRSVPGPCTTSDLDGVYRFDDLEAGTYHVRFYDPNYIYMGENYDNILDEGYSANATDIVVSSTGVISNINVALYPYPRLTGRVTKWDGTTPLTNISVMVYLKGVKIPYGRSFSDTNGNYNMRLGDDLGPMVPGTYFVCFQDPAGIYLPEIYDDLPGTLDGNNVGTEVELIINRTTIINASLDGPPTVVGIHQTGKSHFDILFTGPPSKNHILQEAETLTGGWADVGAPVVSVAGTSVLSRTSTSNSAFWRVRLVR